MFANAFEIRTAFACKLATIFKSNYGKFAKSCLNVVGLKISNPEKFEDCFTASITWASHFARFFSASDVSIFTCENCEIIGNIPATPSSTL